MKYLFYVPDNFKGTVNCLAEAKAKLLRFHRLIWFGLRRKYSQCLSEPRLAPLFPFPTRRGNHLGTPLCLDLNVESLEQGGRNLAVKTLCTAERRIPAPGVAYSGLLETLTR